MRERLDRPGARAETAPERGADRGAQRLLWFVGLWAASVAVVGLVALLIRWALAA